MTDLHGKAAKSVRWTSIMALSTILVQLIQLGILGRYLQPADFGLIAIVQISVVFMAMFSQSPFFEFFIQRKTLDRARFSSLYWLNVVAASLYAVILVLVSPGLAKVLEMEPLTSMLPLAAATIVIGSFGNLFEAAAQKGLDFSVSAAAHVAGGIFGLATVATSISMLEQGVWSYVWGLIVVASVRTTILVGYGKRVGIWPAPIFEPGFLKEVYRFVVYRMGAIATNFISTYLDQMTIALLLGPAATGLYNVALNLTLQPVRIINPILVKVGLPVFAQIQEDDIRLRRAFNKMLRFIVLLQAPLLLGMAVVADPLVPIYLGEQWADAIPVVQVLALYALTRSIVGPTGSLLVAKDKTKWSFHWNLAVLLLVPVVILTAVREGQIVDVAVALLLLQLFLFTLQYFVLLRPLVGRFGREYLGAVAPPVIIASFMAGSVWYGWSFLATPRETADLVIMIVLGVCVYSILLVVFLGPEAKEMLRAFTGTPR